MSMDSSQAPNIPALFLAQAERLGDTPFLGAKIGRDWVFKSWRAAADEALSLAGALTRLGLRRGDRVVLASENRPEWAVADMAVMIAGGITVPAYVTNTIDDHRHILENSGARFIIASTQILSDKMRHAATQFGEGCTMICMDPPAQAQSGLITALHWPQALEMGQGTHADMRAAAAQAMRGDLACIIHTSGTGGAPRGVMLSHGALLADCVGAQDLLKDLSLGDEVFLSFLPLSHSYEHTIGLIFPISIGACIAYAESLDQLGAAMVEIRPTIMTAVPRLYETMRARILTALLRQGGLRAKLFRKAVDLGRRRLHGDALSLSDKAMDAMLNLLVRRKVRDRFGGRLKALVSGGAPLAPDVGDFFLALGMCILQGYGQTEAGPAISCCRPDRIRIDTVGPPLKGIKLRIAADGEILVKGEVLMSGYWRDPDGTARAIDADGWLHTGDVGEIDADGNLRITDRKKDIIVNSGGDNISPQRIEGLLTLQPEIAQAMVEGDSRAHLAALIVAADDGGDSAETKIAAAIERVNSGLSNIEKIRRWALIESPFSTDNLMLTPTLKIRRHVIREHYAQVLERLYH